MKIENGTIINQYKIISAIGKGGMGEVYLAEDTKLDRQVALKILPAEFAKDKDRMSRFVREAKSASALNHPNIITIYEIGESDGTNYIATEFIDGKTLNEYAKANPLNYKSVLEIAIQVASALDEAHRAGIVHRDIKPDNVMIRENGLAKILDFGIAKLSEASPANVSSEDATAIQSGTTPGMIIGTANYMSPEQAKGKEVDARSDIFSFGVVLYEMLAGGLPFEGETAMDTIGAIIHKEPKPLNDDVPNEITKIINKTLWKDKNERYQTIKDVFNDLKDVKQELEFQDKLEKTVSPSKDNAQTQMLKATTLDESNQTITNDTRNDSITIKKSNVGKFLIGGLAIVIFLAIGLGYWLYRGSNTKQIESIAVMPFVNESGNTDSEYLSDGLAESLIYRLSELPNLKVSPTSSVFRYKGKLTDLKIVAQELGVNSVLTGRITQRGDSLYISVNLVDTRNGKSLWGEKYERKMSELLATQTEITKEITDKLQLELSGESEQRLAKKYTDNNEAYQLYLKGQFHFAKRTKDDLKRSIEYFEQAIELDPNFALAYVGIANSYAIMPQYAFLSAKEAIPQSKAAAQKALAIDPTLAEAHSALAYSLAVFDWNWIEVEKEYKRAIELNPNVADIHYRYAMNYLIPVGRTNEAISEIKLALELVPLSLAISANLSGAYMYSRQYDQALEQAKQTYELDPSYYTAHVWLGNIYNVSGRYAEAIELSEKALEKNPTDQYFLWLAGYAYAKSGRRQDALKTIDKFKNLAKTEYVEPYNVAAIYAALGDRDKAFAELEKAFETRDWLITVLNVDPFMDPLRDDPRFRDLVKRMNLPE